MVPELILASASPRRKEILQNVGISFRTVTSHVIEVMEESLPSEDIVQRLAYTKAKQVAEMMKEEKSNKIVLGADTIVSYDQYRLGKPQDEEEAIETLNRLQGKSHRVYTGIALIHMDGHMVREMTRYAVTNVKMRPLSRDKIKWYVSTGEPLDKAGSYGIQGFGSVLVEKIDGCYFNVVGLPISLLDEMLDNWGYNGLSVFFRKNQKEYS